MGKEVEFAVLHGRTLMQKLGLQGRMKIGSNPECELCFEDEAVAEDWGVLFERNGRTYVQRRSGAATALEPGDGVEVGPFALVRADGGPIRRLLASTDLGKDLACGDKLPYQRVILMWDSRVEGASSVSGRLDVDAPPPPSGIMRNPWGNKSTFTPKSKNGTHGRAYYEAQPVNSAATQRVVQDFVRSLERAPSEPGQLERLGDQILESLRVLSYPELVAAIQRVARDGAHNHLETFYRKVLGSSPLLSFRWAAMIAERYAAASRGFGPDAALPRLKIGLSELISSDAESMFVRARANGGKRLAKGPW
ncbi:MAG: hypothetical protein ACYS22_11780 [Planctomycetota bacterium]|jgi:hypothetical protein